MTAKFDTVPSNKMNLVASRLPLRFKEGEIGAERPLESVMTEKTPLRVMVVDDEGRPYRQLTLTLAIDVHSRVIHGFRLGFNRENQTDDAEAGGNAVSLNEQREKLHPDLAGASPDESKLEMSISDRTTEFTDTRFVTACSDRGITGEETKAIRAEHKGFFERALRATRSQFADLLPGGPQFTYARWEWGGTQQEMFMTLKELREALTRWIVKVYHHTPHPASGE